MSENPSIPGQDEQQPVVWRRRVIVIVVLILGVSIAGRVFLHGEEQEAAADGRGLRTGLVAGGGERVEREETLGDKVGKLLPFITEAGMALLLGMILGVGARMAIKTIVLVAIVGVVGIQFAIYKGWLSPDDAGGFIGHMTNYVFNVPEGGETMDVLREKAPSAGAGTIGFLMGLRK